MPKVNLKNERFFINLVKEGSLKVLKNGRAYNVNTGRELGKKRKRDSYRSVKWQHPKTKKILSIQLHRLVWSSFKGVPTDASLVINHIDGIKQNCKLSNLELVSESRNMQHAFDIGLIVSLKGEDRSNSVFTDAQVVGLRRKFLEDKRTVKGISEKYNCSKEIVKSMLKGKTYASIKTGNEHLCAEKLKLNGVSGVDNNIILRIRTLRRKGGSSYFIATKLGISRNTVMKYW